MFWVASLEIFKGPCHLWKPETKKRQAIAAKELEY